MEAETVAKYGSEYRVAVCFTGLKALPLCFPKIVSHYIKPWRVEPTYFYYGPEPKSYKLTDVIPNINYEFEEDSEKNLKPVNNFPHSSAPFCWQWYNIKKCFELAATYKHEFDFFIRIRTDMYPVGRSTLRWDYRNLRKDMVYIPMKLDFGGICDRFAFGTKEIMSVYSSFYDSDHFINGSHNSETRLHQYINSKNIRICYLLENNDLDFCHKDDNGIIRYPGPEVEEKLVHLDKELPVFDNAWWPQKTDIINRWAGPRYFTPYNYYSSL